MDVQERRIPSSIRLQLHIGCWGDLQCTIKLWVPHGSDTTWLYFELSKIQVVQFKNVIHMPMFTMAQLLNSGLITWFTYTLSDFSWFCRPCYFTVECTNKKADFMKCLNSSYKEACLQCSFTDKELAEYIHYKKRNAAPLPRKYAVTVVGKQPDGSWVFSSNVLLTSVGEITDPASSE